MWMAVDKFVAKEVDDIHDIEMLFLLPYLGIEKDMQKHVSEFLRQFMFLAFEDSIAEFIYLFEGLRTQRFVGLLPVPRTFFS